MGTKAQEVLYPLQETSMELFLKVCIRNWENEETC